jgi:hypothetical protein
MRYATIILLLCAFGASVCTGEAAPRAPAGDGESVIHMRGDTILRWRIGETVLLDLKGGAAIYQGDFRVTSGRILVWFNEKAAGDLREAVLDVYAGPNARLPEGFIPETGEASAILGLRSSAGVVIDGGNLLASERPVEDEFLISAAIAHGDLPPEALALAATQTFGLIRPSAERLLVSDLSDQGATITLTGNAQVAADEMVVTADAIRIRVTFGGQDNSDTQIQSLFAMGTVDLDGDVTHITAKALYIDWPLQEGLALDARIRTQEAQSTMPIQFHADVVRQQSLYRFKIEGRGYFSTSLFWFPHYRIESKEIQIVRGPASTQRANVSLDPAEATSKFYQKAPGPAKPPAESLVVSARRNVVYLESVPVLYWPYVGKDVRTGSFLLVGADFGTSSTMGTFLKLRWDLYDLGIYQNDWSELGLRTEYFSERGFGTGLDFAYRGADRVGFLRGYYINDTAKEDDRGIPVPETDRGELTLRHREFLSEEWHADLELGYLSDRRFLRTYDRRAFDTDKDRETMVQLSRISENTLLQIQARARLNDFQTQVERQGVAYHIVGERLGESPLIWTSHTDVAHLQLKLDEIIAMPDPEAVTRFDTSHEVSWPLQAGFVRLDPYLWGDATFFSKDAQGDSAVRGAAAYGIRAATNFYRTFDIECPLLQVDGLRHTITPTAAYENVFAVTDDPSDFIQNDEIDARDEMHRIRLGLRNRFETHRKINGRRATTELALLDADYVAHFKQPSGPTRVDDYVEASARWQISEQVSISSVDDRYNVEKGRMEALNGELTLDFWPPLSISLIHKYYLDLNKAGEPAHSVSLARFAYQPDYSRWKVEFSTAYDFEARSTPGGRSDPAKLGTSVFLTRQMEDWDFSVGAEFNQGRENETVMTFNVTPPGVRRRFTARRGPI